MFNFLSYIGTKKITLDVMSILIQRARVFVSWKLVVARQSTRIKSRVRLRKNRKICEITASGYIYMSSTVPSEIVLSLSVLIYYTEAQLRTLRQIHNGEENYVSTEDVRTSKTQRDSIPRRDAFVHIVSLALCIPVDVRKTCKTYIIFAGNQTKKNQMSLTQT